MAVRKDEEKFELTETQEEYLDIYHQYFVLNWTWDEIAAYHDCSKMTVSNAINWVIDNRLNIPSTQLIKGAIDSIKERLKKNKKLYNKEANKQSRQDKKFVIDLTKQIREDEKMLYELQEVYKGDQSEEEGDKMSASQVLSLIQEATSEGLDKNRDETKDEEKGN